MSRLSSKQLKRLDHCFALAEAIVKEYGREARELNIYPTGGEVWVAGATIAISAGAAAYEASQSGSASSGVSAPKFVPAKFQALDPNSLQYESPESANATATQFDKQGYAASDADFAARHPALAQANRTNEANVASQVEGNVPAGLQNQLITAGLAGSSSGFGNSIVPGSSGAFGVAKGLGVNYMDYVNQGRSALAGLNAADPERQFGISGAGALQLQLQNQATRNSVLEGNFQGQNQVNIANATGQNATNQAGFAGALQANAQQLAATNAAINTGLAGVNSAAKIYGQYNPPAPLYSTPPTG